VTLALAPPATAAAQYTRYDGTVYGSRGFPIGGQNIAICSQPTNANKQPCSPLATIYSNTTGSGGAASSPMVAGSSLEDAIGNFHFYALPDTYTIQIYDPQISGQLVLADQAIGGSGCIPTPTCTITAAWAFTTGPTLTSPTISTLAVVARFSMKRSVTRPAAQRRCSTLCTFV
jgi:hypothetical protein